jgi:pimeloyl-ACP methyl ester carboxylesterase
MLSCDTSRREAIHSNERVLTVTLPDGRALRARLWDGDGPALVLLHGALSTAATWRPLVRATARRCIALDLPGFGASSPTSGPRLECFADDVIAALHALGVRRCTLVGHSFGGAVAVAVAGRSDLVDALVLLAPGGHGSCGLSRIAIDPALGPLAAVLAPVLACSSVLAARPTAAELARPRERMRLLGQELRRAAAVGTTNVRTAVQANERETTGGHAAVACAARFDGPVTIVWGENDRVLPPAHGEAVRRALPRARMHVLEGTGHALHHERPEAVARLIAAVPSPVAPPTRAGTDVAPRAQPPAAAATGRRHLRPLRSGGDALLRDLDDVPRQAEAA